jgi:uncharacterized protein (TIGR03083 family)
VKLSPRYDGSPILSIDGAPDDQRAPVTRQRRRMEQLLAGLSDDEWRAPSRCDEWTNQDVISHLITVNNFWAASVAAGLAGEPTRMLATFDPAAHPPLMVDGMRSLTPREVFDQFVASNDSFLGALDPLDADGWSALAESPAGHVSIRLLAFHAIWDSWIHERDIALPLGLTPAQEPDELHSCLRYAAAVGPALTVSEGTAFASTLAVDASGPRDRFVLEVTDAVAVHDDEWPDGTPCLEGTAVELIEALSIRGPLPADAPAEWRTLLTGLATIFDTELEHT